MYQMKSYLEAQTLEEAIAAASEANGQIIAGGTDVLIKSRERKEGYVDKDWVGIMRIPELKAIKRENNGDIFIGATATFKEVDTHIPVVRRHLASLSTACGTVGGPPIEERWNYWW
ncbi:FAD binding domain-containing protein [endosymbiont 'TC1' of Trimyema compressum]|uniref:FAD binding domain-containing protein n=1 Tax=endosymbiont 'TC1' of Trimyema compressum TaxID=243899 RepID=UPI000AD4B584|nr:FAD binding domain-containing protein [endosymbiont 'TC1' of Trimyema compressum]